MPSHRLRVDFNQLEHAIAAADHGSFRQAAEELSIKQSTLSRSIKMLEHAFGVTIFERTSGGVRATPAGRHFIRMARSIVEQLETLATITRASSRGDAGRLVVGFSMSLTAGNLRATLLEFKRRFGHVQLGTMEGSRTGLMRALRNGAIDLHIETAKTPLFDFKTAPLWTERILLVLPNAHPLATQDVIYWTDLRNQTVLLSQYDLDDEFETLLNAKLLVVSDRPRVERHNVSRGVIKSLISMGLGISLVLESRHRRRLFGLSLSRVTRW